MAFRITTTGSLNPVVFNDIGGRSFAHPTVDFDLESEFSVDEIAESDDIQDAITNGHITVQDANGESITDVGAATSAVPLVTTAEAQTATLVERRSWSPERVGEAIAANAVSPTRTISTNEGIKGGGDLSANRTFSMDIDGLAEDTTPDQALDFIASYDDSASQHKKISIATLLSLMGDLAAVQVRRSTTLAIPTTFADISFDLTDIENDTDVLEHDNTNTDRITIGEDGLYQIAYQCSVDADAGEETISMRVRVNDTTVINGSERTISEDDEINDIGNSFLANLTAGDFITFQMRS